nr:hypothetical protein [Tanacetum cinerariifolium]
MEDTMLEFLDICQEKELYCMHNNVDDLTESAFNSKLLSINLKSQRLDKENQEVKNIVEHPTKRRTRITESLQNFKVIHKMSSISNTTQISSIIAIAPVLPTEEPEYSLSIGNEHFSAIPEMKSEEVIKSSIENLVPIPSESEVTSDNESECDMPVNDESSLIFTTFLNPLFDCNNDFTSSDDKSLSNEDVLMIYLNSLSDDEEIISTKIDPHISEFSGELAHIDPIPSGIKEVDFDLAKEIRLVKSLLYDNSSPRPLEELNAEIADTILESLSPSPILIEDSGSQMKEIDLFLVTYDLMPSGIEYDDYDLEGDIYFLEELLSNDPLSLLENESFNFDHHDDPSFSRPPPEPPDVEIFFDLEPDTGVLTAKVVEDISKHHVLMPKVLPSQPTLCPNINPLLPFSSANEDKVFKPGILSYLFISHWSKPLLIFLRTR